MNLLIENMLNIGKEEFYRTSRYGVPLFVALINTENKKAFNILEDAVRKTDILQQLDSEMLVLFLTHTNDEESLFFMHKIKDKLDFTYTISEFKNSELEFIENLVVDNSEKMENSFYS